MWTTTTSPSWPAALLEDIDSGRSLEAALYIDDIEVGYLSLERSDGAFHHSVADSGHRPTGATVVGAIFSGDGAFSAVMSDFSPGTVAVLTVVSC